MRAIVLSADARARKALSTGAATLLRIARIMSVLVTNTITDAAREKMIFDSLTEAGKALAVSKTAISLALRKGRASQ